MKVIDSFTGKYRFLSNFYPDNDDTLEHKYQASKVNLRLKDTKKKNYWIEKIYSAKTPKEARKIGKYKLPKEVIDPRFESNRLRIMLDLLLDKFSDKRLKKKLLATGKAKLIEGNWWGDIYWGVCKGKGKNMLGRLLMLVREELREDE
jgi:hypothetical protein